MISFTKLRNLFFKTSLVILLATATTFSFASEYSWAKTLTPLVSQPQTYIAMNKVEEIRKDIKGKMGETVSNVSNTFDNITDDLKNKDEILEQGKELQAETLEGMNNSIQNPDYQPSGKTKQAEKEAIKGKKEIMSEARDALKQNTQTNNY
ncbi:MAG: hypothetical protein GW795_08430 [Cyanobacteria bacterium]|nr:hypothetical protein [Cyanobacteria bacterium CG_2015-22_32_23]NCQ41901.1 hypothetical protein [Cyanobacteria bacterium CG_2015-04_32_10]